MHIERYEHEWNKTMERPLFGNGGSEIFMYLLWRQQAIHFVAFFSSTTPPPPSHSISRYHSLVVIFVQRLWWDCSSVSYESRPFLITTFHTIMSSKEVSERICTIRMYDLIYCQFHEMYAFGTTHFHYGLTIRKCRESQKYSCMASIQLLVSLCRPLFALCSWVSLNIYIYIDILYSVVKTRTLIILKASIQVIPFIIIAQTLPFAMFESMCEIDLSEMC